MPKNIKKREQEFREHLIGVLESLKEFADSINKGFKLNAEIWRRFLRSFQWILFFLIILILRKEVVNFLAWIWNSLSESWQIALFMAIWTLIVAIVVLFIDRKYIHKPTNSKTDQNRKNSK